MSKIKVRFNLAKGKNYRHWQVETETQKLYYDPQIHYLTFYKCVLKNRFNQAKKIFEGKNRQPCAWLVAEEYQVNKSPPTNLGKPIFYNPKKYPYWIDSDRQNIDNRQYQKIATVNSQLYILSAINKQLTLFGE
jgi:hypothetical protein